METSNNLVTIFLKLKDNKVGNSVERQEVFELEQKLIDIIESQNLGTCDEITFDHGSLFSRFPCEDPDMVVDAIIDEIKEFNPREDSMIFKIHETTKRTSEKIEL